MRGRHSLFSRYERSCPARSLPVSAMAALLLSPTIPPSISEPYQHPLLRNMMRGMCIISVATLCPLLLELSCRRGRHEATQDDHKCKRGAVGCRSKGSKTNESPALTRTDISVKHDQIQRQHRETRKDVREQDAGQPRQSRRARRAATTAPSSAGREPRPSSRSNSATIQIVAAACNASTGQNSKGAAGTRRSP